MPRGKTDAKFYVYLTHSLRILWRRVFLPFMSFCVKVQTVLDLDNYSPSRKIVLGMKIWGFLTNFIRHSSEERDNVYKVYIFIRKRSRVHGKSRIVTLPLSRSLFLFSWLFVHLCLAVSAFPRSVRTYRTWSSRNFDFSHRLDDTDMDRPRQRS